MYNKDYCILFYRLQVYNIFTNEASTLQKKHFRHPPAVICTVVKSLSLFSKIKVITIVS